MRKISQSYQSFAKQDKINHPTESTPGGVFCFRWGGEGLGSPGPVRGLDLVTDHDGELFQFIETGSAVNDQLEPFTPIRQLLVMQDSSQVFGERAFFGPVDTLGAVPAGEEQNLSLDFNHAFDVVVDEARKREAVRGEVNELAIWVGYVELLTLFVPEPATTL